MSYAPHRRLLVGSSLLVIYFVSCGDPPAISRADGAPAPTPDAGPAAPDSDADAGPPAAPAAPPATEFVVVHEIGEGQTLWDIAKTYGVSVQELLDANSLTKRDVRRLSLGTKIKIPGALEPLPVETAADRAKKREALPEPEDGKYHFLAPGETIWELARIYDVTVEAIMERNGMTDSDVQSFRVGQPIVIPGVTADQARKVQRETKRAGVRHQLASGETIWDLAQTFQVSVSEIMAANGLSKEDVVKLQAGQQLFIPGVERDAGGAVSRKTRPSQRRARALATRLGLGTRQAASALLRGQVKPEWIRAAGGRKSQLPGFLRWPVTNGWFVRGYGSGDNGGHLAVDIAGEIGWNVRAAAPGIVAYSDNTVRGYGNMVIVIHPGGWVTLYAHNSVNFVVPGQKVQRGTILAELGSTGISRGPHVHFTFIYQGNNCDPAVLFKPGIRHRNGKLTPLKYVSWTNPKEHPKAIQCRPWKKHTARVDQETADPNDQP